MVTRLHKPLATVEEKTDTVHHVIFIFELSPSNSLMS